MNNNKIINFLSLAIYFFPLSIIIGNFYSNFIVSITSLLFFVYSIIKKRGNFNNFFFKVFLIFWTLLVIRSIFTSEILFSFKSSFLFIRYAIFCLFFFYILFFFNLFYICFLFFCKFLFKSFFSWKKKRKKRKSLNL